VPDSSQVVSPRRGVNGDCSWKSDRLARSLPWRTYDLYIVLL
jgi:hypothetical protein